MKKRFLSLLMALCLMLTLAPAAFAVDDEQSITSWAETPDTSWYDSTDPKTEYELTTAAQLAGLISLQNDRKGPTFEGITIKLGADIVLNDTSSEDWPESAASWKGIGSGKRGRSVAFEGTLDGQGYAIIGLYEMGLFALLDKDATVQNVVIKDAVLFSEDGPIGAIAAEGDGTIQKCTVDSSCTIVGGSEVGGIVGNGEGSIVQCRNQATVTLKVSEEKDEYVVAGYVGGIVGYVNGKCEIRGCVNEGDIIGAGGTGIGGIVGTVLESAIESATIENCTNNGSVIGGNSVGGIAGLITQKVNIKNCTSAGNVSGKEDVAGVVGTSDPGQVSTYDPGNPNDISGCVVSADITGETNVGGLVGSNDVVDDSEKEATTIANNILTPDASVSGSTNVGALIGDNQTETDTGTIKNNFWPEAAGSASGNGAGSSSDDTTDSTIKTTNSSYGADGTLKTPITAGEGDEETTVETIGDVLDKILTDTETPDALKATVKFDKNGHGSAPSPSTREVVIGTKITLPGIDNDGYWTFLNWTADGQPYNAGAEYIVTENVIFTANWRNDTPSSNTSGGGSSTPTYTVTTPSKVENGTVKVSPKSAGKGDAVTITVTPAKGYEVDEVIVTDKNGKEISVKDKGDGKFTFTMPAGKVTVEASFTKIAEQPRVTFTDVPASAYYYDAVAWAVENGITGGTTATTFSPDAPCTRAQTVTFLWRAAGSPAPRSSVNPFTDVQPGTYYYDAVLWAVENGITTGTTATTFSPNATVTRGQTVTFLHRAAGTTVIGSDPFTDVADSAYYAGAVKWAVAEGITSGTSATTFSPNQVCTRAQIVTFLYRAEA